MGWGPGAGLIDLSLYIMPDAVTRGLGAISAVLVGKDVFSGDKSAYPSPATHWLSNSEKEDWLSYAKSWPPSYSAFPLCPEALVGNGRGSFAPSALKCKEKRGCLLAGGQGGPAGHLVHCRLHSRQTVAQFLLLELWWILEESWLLSFWGWFGSFFLGEGFWDSECTDMKRRVCEHLRRQGQSAACVWYSRAGPLLALSRDGEPDTL